MTYTTLHRKLKIEQHKPHWKRGGVAGTNIWKLTEVVVRKRKDNSGRLLISGYIFLILQHGNYCQLRITMDVKTVWTHAFITPTKYWFNCQFDFRLSETNTWSGAICLPIRSTWVHPPPPRFCGGFVCFYFFFLQLKIFVSVFCIDYWLKLQDVSQLEIWLIWHSLQKQWWSSYCQPSVVI
jgi:hypothetical protein